MEFGPVDKKIIAENLMALRKKSFKSREAFCEVLGMPLTRYAEYEQGRVSLSYEVAWAVADVLECSMDDVGGRRWAGSREGEGDSSEVPPAAQSEGAGERAGNPGDRMDDGALMLAERIASLPGSERKAIQDFVSFQEKQVRDQWREPGEADGQTAKAAAS